MCPPGATRPNDEIKLRGGVVLDWKAEVVAGLEGDEMESEAEAFEFLWPGAEGEAMHGENDGESRELIGDRTPEEPEVEGEEEGAPGPPAEHPQTRPRARAGRRSAVRGRSEVLRRPREPTDQEKQGHYLHHTPPEDWCEACARAKSLTKGHRRKR